MKFLVDNQLPPALVGWLTERGHQAEHVFALGLAEKDDGYIWDLAARDDAVVVTKDLDFAERRLRSVSGPKVLWLRIGNTTTRALLERLAGNWSSIEAGLQVDVLIEVL